MKIRNLIAATVAALAALAAAPAMAFTECDSTVLNVYSGDAGGTNIWLASGVQFYLYANDVNFKNIFSDARLAYLAGKNVRVKFTANGVSCSTAQQRSDAVGFYILG